MTALSSTLPREYVHKSAHSEVLLTGWRAVAPDEFVITAQWPRAPSFYTPDAGHHDPLLLTESVRQAIPLLSHVAYDVPFGHRQICDTFSHSVEPDALAVGAAPADIVMRVSCTAIARRGRRLAGLTSPRPATGSSWAPTKPVSPAGRRPSTSACAEATRTSTRWPPAPSRSRRR
uniref:A-factor biosynthesis hotdog domain-containing protein n=1 Tax=Streptomyces sp. NBC_00049 TaxID=2903617 RepID=A0AAU2JID3_9ACTN